MWLWILTGLCTITKVHGYSSGIFPDSCESMSPEHPTAGGGIALPQTTVPPFEILYQHGKKGDPITVSLQSKNSASFKGFMLEARRKGVADPSHPVGKFISLDTNTRLLTCSGSPGSAVSQRNSKRKSLIKVNWTAEGTELDIIFRATFVESRITFWERVEVDVTLPTTPPPTSTQPITTSTAEPSTTTSTAEPSTTSTAEPSITSTAEPSTTTSTAEPSTTSTAEPSTTTSTAEPSTTTSTAEPSTTTSTAEPSTTTSTAEPSTTTSTAEPSTTSTAEPSTTTNTAEPSTTSTAEPSTTSTAEPSTTSAAQQSSTTSTTFRTTQDLIKDDSSNQTLMLGATVAMTWNIVFEGLKTELPIVIMILSNCPSHYPNKKTKILCSLLCAAAEILAVTLFFLAESFNASLVALSCVVMGINLIELIIVSLPFGPSHELNEICDLAVKVCSVIHKILSIAVILVVVSTDDRRDFCWLLKVMFAYTAWISLFVIWIFIFGTHGKEILRTRQKGSSKTIGSWRQKRQKKKLTRAEGAVITISAVFVIGTVFFTFAVNIGLFFCT